MLYLIREGNEEATSLQYNGVLLKIVTILRERAACFRSIAVHFVDIYYFPLAMGFFGKIQNWKTA